jgi:multiple sugar transport system ATP-binding protein
LREETNARKFALGVRPEHVSLSDGASLRGEVFGTEYFGTTQIVTITTPHGAVKARIAADQPARRGETVGLALRSERLSLFDVESGRALRTALHEGAAHG